ncbi:major histocompatibility complex class I-related gene protein-like isoform X2 [Periophthalmus magnuspinnatus]|uniref:major histocompatibility complex class I-related gene protein-like isoform X2 n=1 Tax=Periophthalmus magnuspinnatus TaxID=409849 RepID=UPI00145B5206|nr:major histocompatibility complex class I-related gene protein-like isoform X2 [Periophthalmus magnuspinnatus]
MKTFVALILLGILIKDSTSMIHSLRYFDTSSSQVPNFPEYVVVGVVNGLEIMRCDSETRRYEPKQEWMNRVTGDDPKFWDWTTQLCVNNLQVNKGSIENIKQRFNQTEGAHIWQRMFGCDWDDETDDITGYYQYAFDGQDFISLDLSTESWVAAKSEAFATKLRWERIGQTQRHKHYVHKVCTVWLKNYVRYGEKTLKRTELPLVSLLQKSSSSPVTCHATGFYPDRAMLFWTKDGDELLEDVDPGEILPNEDGTFQTSVSLDLSSVPPEDWDRYHCVFQLSGVKEDYVTRLDRSKIRTNAKNPPTSIIAAVVVVGVVIVAAAVALFVIRRKRAQNNPRQDAQLRQNLNPVTPATNSGETSDPETQTLRPGAPEAESTE